MIEVGVEAVPHLVPRRSTAAVMWVITRELSLTSIGLDVTLVVLPTGQKSPLFTGFDEQYWNLAPVN